MDRESSGRSSSTEYNGAGVEHWRLSETTDFYRETALNTRNWQAENMRGRGTENDINQFRKRRSHHMDQEMDRERSDDSSSTDDSGQCVKYRRMSDTTDNDVNLDRIRGQLNNFYEPEKDILEDLDLSKQTTAESQCSQENIELQQKITELLTENANLREFMDRQITDYASKLNTAESIIIMLRQDMDANSAQQKASEFRATELQEARMKINALELERLLCWNQIQDLYPKAMRTSELEKELLLAKETNSNVCRSGTGKGLPGFESFCYPEELGKARVKDEVLDLEYEQFGPILHEVPSSTAVRSKSVRAEPTTLNHNEHLLTKISNLKASEVERQGHNERIKVGLQGMYILASHPTEKFSNMNFKACYQKDGAVGYKCNLCLCFKKEKVTMIDHIWANHYNGRFDCPFCIHPAGSDKTGRYKVTTHIRSSHFNAF